MFYVMDGHLTMTSKYSKCKKKYWCL